MRTLTTFAIVALATSMYAEDMRSAGKFWNSGQAAQIQQQSGFKRLTAQEMAHNQDSRPSSRVETQAPAATQVQTWEEPKRSVVVPSTEGANTERVPMCTSGNESDLPNPPKAARGTVNDVISNRNYISIAIINSTPYPLKEVFAGGVVLARNLCPGGIEHRSIERSFFSKKKPHVLQITAVDAKGNVYSSQPITFDESMSLTWSIGENDARPLSSWEQKVARQAIQQGLDPDLEIENTRRAQVMLGANPGYGGGYPQQQYGYPNSGGLYNTSMVQVGSAVYSGNVEVMRPGVGHYGPSGYNPYYEAMNGPGTSYIANSCGTIFAPATWPNCNRPIQNFGFGGFGGFGGGGYGRPRRGIYGGVRATIGFGF